MFKSQLTILAEVFSLWLYNLLIPQQDGAFLGWQQLVKIFLQSVIGKIPVLALAPIQPKFKKTTSRIRKKKKNKRVNPC